MSIHKKRIARLLLGMLLIFAFSSSAMAVPTVDPSIKIHDFAELIDSAAEEELSAAIAEVSFYQDLDLVIVTTNDNEGLSSMEYADDFFDYNDFGIGDENDGILMLLDMDVRQIWISTTGKGISYFNDAAIEWLLDGIYDCMVDADYLGACWSFIYDVDDHVTLMKEELADQLQRQEEERQRLELEKRASKEKAQLEDELTAALASRPEEAVLDLGGVLSDQELNSLTAHIETLWQKHQLQLVLLTGAEQLRGEYTHLGSFDIYLKLWNATRRDFEQGIILFAIVNSEAETIDIYSHSADYSLLPSDYNYSARFTSAFQSYGLAAGLEQLMPELAADADRYWDEINSTGYKIGKIMQTYIFDPIDMFTESETLGMGAIAGAVIAAIFAFILIMRHSSSMPGAPSLHTYIGDSLNVTRQIDKFLHSHTSKTAKPKQSDSSSSGGGTSTHSSSSGTTHGGGGRSF